MPDKAHAVAAGDVRRVPQACVRRSADGREIIRIVFDHATGLIRAYAAGAWSIDDTRYYLAGLEAFVTYSRLRIGKARVLLDRREVSVQLPEVASLLAAANGTIFGPDDRIALVVSSSVAKAGLRQRMPHPGSKAFLSIDAAAKWLEAFARG